MRSDEMRKIVDVKSMDGHILLYVYKDGDQGLVHEVRMRAIP
jgi:hypothetical protein